MINYGPPSGTYFNTLNFYKSSARATQIQLFELHWTWGLSPDSPRSISITELNWPTPAPDVVGAILRRNFGDAQEPSASLQGYPPELYQYPLLAERQMWIKEALTDPPPGLWAVIAAGWVHSAALTVVALALGHALDATLIGAAPHSWFVLAAAAALLAAASNYVVSALPQRQAATEEQRWRRHILGQVLTLNFQHRPVSGSPTHGRARPAAHGGARTAAAHGGARPAAHGHARPAAAHGRAHSGAGEGVTLEALTTSVENTANYRANFLAPTLAAFTSPLIVVAMWAVFLDGVSAAIVMGFLAFVPAVVMAASKTLRRSTGAYRRKQALATHSYLEMLEGLGTFKVLEALPQRLRHFAASTHSSFREITSLLARNQLMIVVNDIVFGVGMASGACALVLWRYATDAISAGAALSGIVLSVLLYEPVNNIGRSFYVGLGGRAHRDATTAAFGAPSNTSTPSPADADTVATSGTLGDIELREVSVDLGGTPILKGINLLIPTGARVFIVGPSGSGKSTLLRVLAGLQPIQGQIFGSGVPLSQETLLAHSALVEQQPGIFHDTIAANLRLAQPEATTAQLQQALVSAHLWDEIQARSGGIASAVGDGGAALSGGQRRRLALARVWLQHRELVLADEPTADLDHVTEAAVSSALAALGAHSTCVTVAHRLHTIADEDTVVVLEDGRITQVGTAAEVKNQPGFFANALAAGDDRSPTTTTTGAHNYE